MRETTTIKIPKSGARFLKSNEAASFLGIRDISLRESRRTGYLLGLEAPPYLNLGRYIRYDLLELTIWSRLYKIGGAAR